MSKNECDNCQNAIDLYGMFTCTMCGKTYCNDCRKKHMKQLWLDYPGLQRIDICKECQQAHDDEIRTIESYIEIKNTLRTQANEITMNIYSDFMRLKKRAQIEKGK